MEESQTARDLDQLLAEQPEKAGLRAAAQVAFREGDALVLYGAGTLGRMTLKRLRGLRVEPVAFADDTPEKQGQRIDGLEVMTPQQAVETFGDRIVFAVTIMNPMLRFLVAEQSLKKLSDVRVISFLHLAWQYPQAFLPYYQFELPQDMLQEAEDIRRAFNLWADDESRRQFVAHIRFRLRLDHEALPLSSGQGYFAREFFPGLPDNTVFVDCGAYDGDTIRGFIAQQGGRFSRIYAFEPDEINCRKLSDYVNGLGDEVARKVSIFNAGVGAEHGTIGFNPTGNMSASFTQEGDVEVAVLPLQEIVKVNGELVFLKFDVEGAEWEALKGAEELLVQSRPLLAISVYHQPDDLWQLPLYIESLDLGYSLFLRTQGEDGMDVICYAIPPTFPLFDTR
jgi:FkbM family methyltransferase